MAAGGYEEYAWVADLYDYVPLYRNRGDIDFYVDAAVRRGGPVLEVGCGTGRILVPTARAGVEIVGLDLSQHMLDVCRAKLRDEADTVQSRVRLVAADMRDFDLGRRFTLATLPFRAFQHLLTTEDQLSCLAAIRRHLVAGGVLILDLFNPSLDMLVNTRIGEEHDEGQPFELPDGRRVKRTWSTLAADRCNQVNEHELAYYVTHPDGREERLSHRFRMRYLFRFEAEHLLARAGFEVEHLYGGPDKSAFGSSYPGELLFVARPGRQTGNGQR